MFTGIIETTGTVKKIEEEGTNKTFTLAAPFAHEMKVNDSLSHNGVCLTITGIAGDSYQVTAVQETLQKTNLGALKLGDIVNLERAMASGYRFDGHMVQGHVDQTGVCTYVEELEGSWLFDFEFDHQTTGNFLVEKGSICIDGVSLTVFNVEDGKFRVTIIPHTMEVTTFKTYKKGSKVNLEFDVVGKYIKRLFELGYKEAIANK
ncbi:MAG: riboflavin synthase [Cyclobacteriaceae bacterium]|nr:riboflavin synthase [Cyclobacteriaceae bacterium]